MLKSSADELSTEYYCLSRDDCVQCLGWGLGVIKKSVKSKLVENGRTFQAHYAKHGRDKKYLKN